MFVVNQILVFLWVILGWRWRISASTWFFQFSIFFLFLICDIPLNDFWIRAWVYLKLCRYLKTFIEKVDVKI